MLFEYVCYLSMLFEYVLFEYVCYLSTYVI